jgi:DNA-binding Lrp family transcriptional regulator
MIIMRALCPDTKNYYVLRYTFHIMKEIEKKLLGELLRNSKRSDRELARALDISQPTITRAREKLEREGFVRDYTIVPDWRKLGFEIMVFTFLKMHTDIRSEELAKKVKQYAANVPFAIYVAYGEGLGVTGVVIALHKSYGEYFQQLSLFRTQWKEYIEDIQSFISVLGEGEVKPLSFTYLAKTLTS